MHDRRGAGGIPIRVGIIALTDSQQTEAARTELLGLGVAADAIGFDRLRAFGRGAGTAPDEADTCGQCGHGTAAILPDGTVTPCVFTRAAAAGSLHQGTFGEIVADEGFASQVARLDRLRRPRLPVPMAPCVPVMRNPERAPYCSPSCIPGGCAPTSSCGPDRQCQPKYSCGPCAPKDRACNPDMNCRPNKCRPN